MVTTNEGTKHALQVLYGSLSYKSQEKLINTWGSAWVILDEGTIRRKKGPGDEDTLGRMFLDQIEITDEPPLAFTLVNAYPRAHPDEKKWRFRAKTEAEREMWVTCINKAIETAKATNLQRNLIRQGSVLVQKKE